MKVLKFGGSSVSTAERIINVGNILKERYVQGDRFAVVFSAFGGITDLLLTMSKLAANGDLTYQQELSQFHERHLLIINDIFEDNLIRTNVLEEVQKNHEVLKNLLYGIFLVRECSPRTLDYVLSFGERNSAFIISQLLVSIGIKASYLDARKVIKTDNNFGKAKVNLSETKVLIKNYFLQKFEIQITTGFIASSKGGLTTTLGRGGSDYTASLIAVSIDATIIEIWTDVNGVLTADPRKVQNAFTIPKMTYAEAMEMAHFGAKVIYPPTLMPAYHHKIPLIIKNTFNPEFEGTLVSFEKDNGKNAVKGISSINSVALLTLQGSGLFGTPGIASRLFSSLAEGNINIILITQGSSEHSISFAVDPKKAKKAKDLVEQSFEFEIKAGIVDPVKVELDLAVVAVIGERMRYQPGVAGRLFKALGKNGINAVAIAQGSSELNISVVINKANEAKALNALHDAYFLSEKRSINLFIVGVGLIGGTLLDQINNQKGELEDRMDIDLRVVGIANSKRMYFDAKGIDLNHWKEKLSVSEIKMDGQEYLHTMKQLNLTNSIFVDNTASNEISDLYDAILDSSISISTPNKFAASSPFARYTRLKKIAARRGVHFFYETNVGAGLPVISTIHDLTNSGDDILKIEGVLSGSLSYIFNAYNSGSSFKESVLKAMELGFTEPDPRIDLRGEDVKRKILILGREIGIPLEEKNVQIKSFLPKECLEADSVEAFLETLDLLEEAMENRKAAIQSGNKLCFVAKATKEGAVVALEEVNIENPFYNLSGSDNMIVITSTRYNTRPLVVRGPGAGAEVTAAGVFAEIIRITNFL